MNEFSILCRVLGTLYYRQPQDPLLVPLFTLIREGKLAQNWPLEQDDLLERLQKSCDMQQIATDYNALFVGDECRVSPYRSAWQEGATEAEVRAFLSTRGMPLSDTPADHIGTLLLAASWIEDNAGDDENEAIETCSKRTCCRGSEHSWESRSACHLAILENAGSADPRRYRGNVG
jgi:TorA maturation chaperone TorD